MKVMKKIKRFLLDESGTAEATSTVIMIAAVGILLATGLILWYGKITTFFTDAGNNLTGLASQFTLPGS
jgi:Flp pilus assembly pilin Flp